MKRKAKTANRHHTTKQKGHSRRGSGVGTYSRLNKRRTADRYNRPYLDGTYGKDEVRFL
jgi:hypothetical protein